MPLHTEVGLSPGHIVLDGDPSPKTATAPSIFGQCLLWPYTAEWFTMPLGREVGLGPGNIVLDGDRTPLQKPPLLAHIYCGQTVGWIKMPLGTEVRLSQTTLC